MTKFNVTRRGLLGWLSLAGAATFSSRALAVTITPTTFTVLSSYPTDFTAQVEAAFEKAFPQYRMQLIWRMSHDAQAYLEDTANDIDVYWAASPKTFATLAGKGRLRKLPEDLLSLPSHIGAATLRDADNTYMATEVAGFGFAVSPERLRSKGIAEPRDWGDLTSDAWAGQIALPIPAKVGFAPPMVEIVLQAYGWNRGWALWNEIAGNSVLVDRGADAISDRLRNGEQLLGLSIDFFISQAIANGAPLKFIYPGRTGLNPGHVALLKGGHNPDAGTAFVRFLLSPEGQALQAHPDLRRLPVRPDVYPALGAGFYNPFTAAEAGSLNFDSDRARPRLALSSALFQQMLVEPHENLVALWRSIHAAEAAGKNTADVRAVLCRCPLDAGQADDPELQARFSRRPEIPADKDALFDEEKSWAAASEQQRLEAQRLLAAL